MNEQGTTAAWTSAAAMAVRGVVRKSLFRADHPFVYLIVDTPTRCVLFLGRLLDPA